MKKPLTKFDVSIGGPASEWIVYVRKKMDSQWDTFDEAFERWAELTRLLPAYKG